MNGAILPDSAHGLGVNGLSVVLGGHKVLKIPSLEVRPGEVLVIIGPNGSGKTTLLLSLASLLKPTTGTIQYQGAPYREGGSTLQLRRKFAVVFQEPLLLNTSVWDNVALGLRLRGIGRDETGARVRKWLGRFGIASLAKRQARSLSGGEAKRASLARAFALQPEVLFLDEPFTALDSPTRQTLIEDFESVLRETKVTTVMVTHDRTEALVLADRVAVLLHGCIRQIGAPEEVFAHPADEDIAGFVEAGSIVHGVVSSRSNGLVSIRTVAQDLRAVSTLALPEGTEATAYVRYEDVAISLPLPQSMTASTCNQPRGKIVKTSPVTGSLLKVSLDCGFTLAAIITKRSWQELGLELGKEVVATFKASSVHLLPTQSKPGAPLLLPTEPGR